MRSTSNAILFFTSFPPPNTGQAIQTKLIFDSLRNNSFEVHLINTIDKNRITRASGKFDFTFTLTLLKKLWQLLVKAFKYNYKYVYIVYGPTKSALYRDFISVLLIKMFSRSKIIGHINSGNYGDNFKSAFSKKLFKYIINRTSTIIFPDQSLNRIREILSDHKAQYIPNMTSGDVSFNDTEVKEKIRNRNSKNVYDIFYISNMIPEKGYEDLLDAVKILSLTFTAFHLHFVGGWTSEESKESFFNKIKASNIAEKVIVHGQVNDRKKIKYFFLQADIFVLPTYYSIEAQPLSIIEAFNAATPVISTLHASIPGMIKDGENGFLVNKRAPQEIADALLKIVESAILWEKMAATARTTFLEKYDKRILLPKLSSLFKDKKL